MKEKELMNNAMDPILIEIYKIKDIEEISFRDLVPTDRSSKINVMPGLFIIYDGGKYFSLTSQDKYFDVFVRKVFQVYNLEKDREIVDPEFDPFGHRTKLRIDDKTKQILESGDITKINEIYSFYDGKKSYEQSLLFRSDELRMLLPVVKYHLKKIFDCTDRTVTFESDAISGYRNNFTLGYKYDGIDDLLYISFVNYEKNEAELVISSRNKNFKPLTMRIIFGKTSIDVFTNFDDYGLYGSDSYQVNTDNSIIHTFEVTKSYVLGNGKVVNLPKKYKNEVLEKVENPVPNISALDSSDDVIWYRLPWNAMYGVKNEVEKISEVEEIVMTHNKYLALVGNEFMMREYASKEYHRLKTFDANANLVVMDEVDKRLFGILLDKEEGIYAIETYFADDLRGNGYYDTYLSDRYFYHLTQSKDRLLSLNTNDLISISKDDNIIRRADLLIIENAKRKLKR